MSMSPTTHNGFILKYKGYIFPVSRSNEITREYFYLRGGLANGRNAKMKRRNGSHVYYTYHDISFPNKFV